MRIWVDDIRPAPKGYVWIKSVNGAKTLINNCEALCEKIEVIDIDHDAGDFVDGGGDYIKLLDWLEETGRNYPIRIHSQNPVGVANMKAIIEKNNWNEIHSVLITYMTREEMMDFIRKNPNKKISHVSFGNDEYILYKEDGKVYDENNYIFEDFTTSRHNGLRFRVGGLWESGWYEYYEKE